MKACFPYPSFRAEGEKSHLAHRLGFLLAALVEMTTFHTNLIASSEILPDTRTEIVVRKHPKIEQEYVSIVSLDEPRKDLDRINNGKYSRPDYRMLDPHTKSGDIPYDGPVSSRKKVYVLAASLATAGAASAVAGAALFPATVAASSASGGGAGLAAAGAATAAAGGAISARALTQPTDLPEDYARIQESRLLETQSDFYKMHIEGKNSAKNGLPKEGN